MHWRLQRAWNQWGPTALRRRWQRWRSPPSLLPHQPHPLTIPTYDGSGQATHPDVIQFPTPWRGHPLWMVMTPYPRLEDQWENPSLLVSDDGLAWRVPPGLENPLVPTPARGYHADPDLIHRPDRDELWLYYLHTIRGEEQHLRLITSGDGIHWSPPRTLFSVPYQELRSPALVWEGAARGLRMWNVNVRAGHRLELRHSPDGLAWGPPEALPWQVPGHMLSHIDVVADPRRGRYWLLAQTPPHGGGPSPLFFTGSPDGRAWEAVRRPLMTVHDGPVWSRLTLYRSTFQLNGDTVRVWYSGRGPGNDNRLGHSALPLERVARQLGLSTGALP